MNEMIKNARQRGLVPDWAWYQMNGESAQNNWIEQRQAIMDQLADQETAEEVTTQFLFTSEVKIK